MPTRQDGGSVEIVSSRRYRLTDVHGHVVKDILS